MIVISNSEHEQGTMAGGSSGGSVHTGRSTDIGDGLVSVIVPTYNRSQLLPTTLNSVWAQSYRPIEVILVDDGSTDDTAAVVETWGKMHADSRCFTLRYVAQVNRGPAAARNHGLRLSRGEYVQFLDSDDRLDWEKLAAQVSVLKTAPELDAVIAQVAFLDDRSRPGFVTAGMDPLSDEGLSCFLCWNDIVVHAPLHRRRLLERLGGFDESLAHSEDVNLHFRMALSGAHFGFMPDVLAYVPQHGDRHRVSLRLKAAEPEFTRRFCLGILAFGVSRGTATPEFRAALAERLVSTARRYFGSLKPRTARVCLVTAREICPEFRSGLARLYLAPGGGALGTVFESSRRALGFAGRRLQWVGRLLGAQQHEIGSSAGQQEA